jgi:hypothetical protein
VALAKLARDVRPDEMQMGMVPGAPQMIDGASYWIPDVDKMQSDVAKLLYFNDPSGQSVKVEVLNGSGIPGNAQRVADQLRDHGYTITATGNADNFEYGGSKIIVRKGGMDGVQKLAQLLNCTNIREESPANTTSADVTVIVGKDYQTQ